MRRFIRRHPALFLAAAAALVALVGAAFAYEYPMVPIPNGQGAMVPGGLNGPMVTNTAGAPPTPPGCDGSLNMNGGCINPGVF